MNTKFNKKLFDKIFKEFQFLDNGQQKTLDKELLFNLLHFDNFYFDNKNQKKKYLLLFEEFFYFVEDFNNKGFNYKVIEIFFKMADLIENKTVNTVLLDKFENILDENFSDTDKKIDFLSVLSNKIKLSKKNSYFKNLNLN